MFFHKSCNWPRESKIINVHISILYRLITAKLITLLNQFKIKSMTRYSTNKQSFLQLKEIEYTFDWLYSILLTYLFLKEQHNIIFK